MQSTVNTLRQYLLSSRMNWLEALPLALWGLNDLPGTVGTLLAPPAGVWL